MSTAIPTPADIGRMTEAERAELVGWLKYERKAAKDRGDSASRACARLRAESDEQSNRAEAARAYIRDIGFALTLAGAQDAPTVTT